MKTEGWIELERSGGTAQARRFVNMDLVKWVDVEQDGRCQVHFANNEESTFSGITAQALKSYLILAVTSKRQ